MRVFYLGYLCGWFFSRRCIGGAFGGRGGLLDGSDLLGKRAVRGRGGWQSKRRRGLLDGHEGSSAPESQREGKAHKESNWTDGSATAKMNAVRQMRAKYCTNPSGPLPSSAVQRPPPYMKLMLRPRASDQSCRHDEQRGGGEEQGGGDMSGQTGSSYMNFTRGASGSCQARQARGDASSSFRGGRPSEM